MFCLVRHTFRDRKGREGSSPIRSFEIGRYKEGKGTSRQHCAVQESYFVGGMQFEIKMPGQEIQGRR